jgi:site-specific recombinase XerD
MGIAAPLEEYIAPQPGRTVPHPIPEGPSGVERMIAKAKNYEQEALTALIGFVGCRVGEALSLTHHHFDVQSMLLTIRGKGDKTRIVPISPHAWQYIQSAYVLAINKEDGKLISYKDRFARQIIKNLGERAKLQRAVSSHDLRATFATAAYDRTQNIRVVQELLGHASSETTEIYTGVTDAALKDAVNFA